MTFEVGHQISERFFQVENGKRHFRQKKQPIQSYGGVKTGYIDREGRELLSDLS